MSFEMSQAVVRRLYEDVLTHGQLDVLDEIVAEDILQSGATAGWPPGREGFRQHVVWARSLIPDARFEVSDIATEGDLVVVSWAIVGILTKPIWGVVPTGKQVAAHAISRIRISDGRIAEYEPRPDRERFVREYGTSEASS